MTTAGGTKEDDFFLSKFLTERVYFHQTGFELIFDKIEGFEYFNKGNLSRIKEKYDSATKQLVISKFFISEQSNVKSKMYNKELSNNKYLKLHIPMSL